MGPRFDSPAKTRIERFLRDHPDGHLHVVTGYTSMAGLAWLASKTAHRPVTVVIGDLRTGLSNFKARDAADAAEFISRSDVQILNWYRTDRNKNGAAAAHSKVYAVEYPKGQPVAVLAGSANLTITGLNANVETMVEAVPPDRDAVFKQVLELESKAFDASDLVMKKARPPQREPAGTGCLPVALSSAIALGGLTLLGRRFSVNKSRLRDNPQGS